MVRFPGGRWNFWIAARLYGTVSNFTRAGGASGSQYVLPVAQVQKITLTTACRRPRCIVSHKLCHDEDTRECMLQPA